MKECCFSISYLILGRDVLSQGVIHVEAEKLDLLQVETSVDENPAKEMEKGCLPVKLCGP